MTDDLQDCDQRREGAPGWRGKWRGGTLVDWALMIAAVSSASWALVRAPELAHRLEQSTVVFDSQHGPTNAAWFIDQRNVIHWEAGSAEGATGLAWSFPRAPATARVLAHPDSLVEPLVRTIEVLQQAGTRQIHIAVSDQSPFPIPKRRE